MTPLLAALFAKNETDFYTALTVLLQSKGLSHFTLWEVEGGMLCKPVGGKNGIQDGIFDIYDLGYAHAGSQDEKSFIGNHRDKLSAEINLNAFDERFPVYAGIFCADDDRLILAVSFHEPVEESTFRFVKELAPFAAYHAAMLKLAGRQLELFVDYQKKLDFIKDSGAIFRPLSRNDAILNALNYFADAFHAEAACVIISKENFFAGTGITQDDLTESISVSDIPLSEYLQSHTDTRYITDDLYSEKFNIANLFLVQDPVSSAIFALFNISGDVVPDRELSALIAHLISIAIENASRHEQETQLKIEQAEMEQTVAIIQRFVHHEVAIDGPPVAYGVNYPARSTGGDYSTIVDTDEYTFICLADVCGKGFSAATLTVMLATVIELGHHDYRNIGGIANDINQYLLNKNFSSRFITGFISFFDKQTKKLHYVSCGHEPTMLLRNGSFTELRSKNVPMGILEEPYEIKEVDILPGDLMFVYSDGVIEYTSYDGLKERLLSLQTMPPHEIATSLYTALVSDPAHQRDDFTCTVVKF